MAATNPGNVRGSSELESGWFWPTSARKCHYDPGHGTALCGKWARKGFGGAAPLQGGADSPASPDDCVACRRKLEATR